MRIAISAALLIATLRGPVSAQQTGISGLAVEAVTHQPLPGVHIRLLPATGDEEVQPTKAWGAISRKDGTFSILGVPAGFYNLFATRNGYIHLAADAGGIPAPSTLSVKAGEGISDLRIEMTAEATITGHVFDENGDPVQNFFIEAEPAHGPSVGSAEARTDERGQFRIVLWPGKFYLKARSLRVPPTLPTADGNATEPTYLPVYYPASENRASASIVELAPGQQAAEIDFHITPARTLRISGRVSGISEGGNNAVVLLDRDGARRLIPTGPDGMFTAVGLPPARYRLAALYNAHAGFMQSQIADIRLESADETGIVLALVPGDTVSGTVGIVGGRLKDGGLDHLNVQLAPVGVSYAPAPDSTVVDSSGRFHLEKILPGRFLVRALPLPENAYLKSIKVDGSEVTNGVVDFSNGVHRASLQITVSLGAATLEGQVMGDDDKPFPFPCLVFLGTTPDTLDDAHLQTSEPDGHFRFTSQQPGKYRLIAINPKFGMRDSATLKPLFEAAPEFEIHERDRIRKNVKIALPYTANATP